MKRALVVIGVLLMATGCRKHEDGVQTGAGVLPGTGSTSQMTYSGAVQSLSGCGQTCVQSIPVDANVIDHPGDRVNVWLCRNADCAVSIPAVQCSTVYLNPAYNVVTQPCYTTMPSPNITLGKNTVGLVNAFEPWCPDQACVAQVPGYSSYAIQTTVTR